MFALGIAIGVGIGALIGIVIMALMASSSYDSENEVSNLNHNYLTEFSDELSPKNKDEDNHQ